MKNDAVISSGRSDPSAAVSGRVVVCSLNQIAGVVNAPPERARPVELEIYINGQPKARILVEGDGVSPERRFHHPITDAGTRNLSESDMGVKIVETGEFLEGSPITAPLGELSGVRVPLAELSTERRQDTLPYLDRRDIDESSLTADQRFWRENGFLRLQGLIDQDKLDAYAAVRWQRKPDLQGWRSPTPYLHVPEMRAVCCDGALAEKLTELIGQPMGLHLNLTNWVSTERNWHQDDFLSPPALNGHSLAVWIALDDIHEDAGPFEFLRGSHRWPVMRQSKVKELLPPAHRSRGDWPNLTQHIVAEAVEQEIKDRGVEPEAFIAKRGEILIWHSCLMHRGSPPRNRELLRKGLIAHYSSINHRPGFKPAVQAPEGGWYFPFDHVLY